MSFIAMSRVKFPPALGDAVRTVGHRLIPIARDQPGLIDIAFHQSLEGDETVMIWEWRTRADHEACQHSPTWAKLMQEAGDLFQSPGVAFSLETYERLV